MGYQDLMREEGVGIFTHFDTSKSHCTVHTAPCAEGK